MTRQAFAQVGDQLALGPSGLPGQSVERHATAGRRGGVAGDDDPEHARVVEQVEEGAVGVGAEVVQGQLVVDPWRVVAPGQPGPRSPPEWSTSRGTDDLTVGEYLDNRAAYESTSRPVRLRNRRRVRTQRQIV